MTFEGKGHRECLEINLSDYGLIEAWKTVVAFMNMAGGILVLSSSSTERLAKFIQGLEEEIKPPADTWQLAEVSRPEGKAYSFVFHATGRLHKLRGMGTFIRSQGRNQRLSVQEKNVLIKKLFQKSLGQADFFEVGEGVEKNFPDLKNSFFGSPIPIPSLQIQVAELLRQRGQPRDVFISYSHQDYALAHQVSSEIENLGLSVWIDERVLQPGDVLTSDIARGISKSKIGIVIISGSSKESYWVQSELSLMLFNQRFHNRNFAIVPVLTDNSPAPRELSEIIYVDLREGGTRKISELAKRARDLVNQRVG